MDEERQGPGGEEPRKTPAVIRRLYPKLEPDVESELGTEPEPPPDTPEAQLPATARATEVVTVPLATAPIEDWEEALQKRIIETAMSPRGQAALLEGIIADDLRERRLWWQLLRDLGFRKQTTTGGDTAVKVTVNTGVPAPEREDGPIKARDITPRR